MKPPITIIINPTFWLVLTKISVMDFVVSMRDLGQSLMGEFNKYAIRIINAPIEKRTTTDGIFLYNKKMVIERAIMEMMKGIFC